MRNLYKNLIEYSGISKYIPKGLNSYKEVDVESIIKVKKDNIKIKEIVKVSTLSNIMSTRVIKTPVCESLEGQRLTGEKYVIEGELSIRVDYLSKEEVNRIYCLNHKEFFSSSIILHKDLIGGSTLIPSIFIETINGELLSEGEVLVINSILATVEM
ncbi:hypothetical protein ACQPU1_13395 [Clostridium paraputrificum]|uniref:hypothetical protein n=1 Tax=Clostridium TaxID=1485 RepID=UPI003D33AF29